jgi:crotonobetainyl-CoA:carnitine CoA-transferase CaiB-like acyl-CoA transferase
VYCSLSGFGHNGPYRDYPAHDGNYLSLAGVLGLIGEPDRKPVFPLNLVADYAGASMHGALGIMFALFARERTGRGQRIETSLLRGVLALQSGIAVDYPGKPTLRRDNPTYRLYQAGDDGWFFLACGNQSFWVKLCRALALDDLAHDPRFASWLLRMENNAALLPILTGRFRAKPRAEWLEILAAHDIPAAPVQTLMDFFEDPAVRHHDMIHEYDHPEVGRLRLMGQPLVFVDTPTRDPGPPPTLGQHTDEVLEEAGFDADAIADLRLRKVVR